MRVDGNKVYFRGHKVEMIFKQILLHREVLLTIDPVFVAAEVLQSVFLRCKQLSKPNSGDGVVLFCPYTQRGVSFLFLGFLVLSTTGSV